MKLCKTALLGCLPALAVATLVGAAPEPACTPGSEYYSGKGVPFSGQYLQTRGEFLVYDNGLPLEDFNLPGTQYDNSYPFLAEVADDFILFGTQADQTQITRIQQWFGYFNVPAGHTSNPETDWAGVMVTIYEDNNGEPDGLPQDNGTHTNSLYTFIVPINNVIIGDMQTFDCTGDFWEANIDVSSNNVMLDGGTTYWIALAPVHQFSVSGQTSTYYSVDPTTGYTAHQAFPLLSGDVWNILDCNVGGCGTAPPGEHCDIAYRLYGVPFDAGTGGCPGDLTGDEVVDINDIFEILGLWGNCPDPCPPSCVGDLTGDCVVDINDIFEILGLWGDCPLGEPLRACCIYDGQIAVCEDLGQADCEALEVSRWFPDQQCAIFDCPPPPPNDSCNEALEVIIDDPAVFGDTTFFFDTNLDGCVPGLPIQAPTAWYFVIGDGTELTANLCVAGTGSWDHMMNIFCGLCDDPTCVDGADDTCGIPGSGFPGPQVTWCSEIGQVYYVAISGVTSSEVGEFFLEVTSNGTPCDDPPQCFCELDPPCTNTEGEECYTDWDGVTPVQDTFNGGWNSCDLVFSDNLNQVAGGEVCGDASDYLTPTDGSYPDCDGVFGDPVILCDTDWYRLNVPNLGGGGASAVIDFNAEFLGHVLILNDSCATSTDDVLVVGVVTNEERCTVIEDQVVDWLEAGGDYILFVSNLDDDVICDNAEYWVSISYTQGTPPPAGCQGEPAYTTGVTSDVEPGFIVADDFRFDLPTVVDEVSWVGMNFVNDGGWIPCDPPTTVNMVFDIHYYVDADADGCPDTPAFASFLGITADSAASLGEQGFGTDAYQWTYNHGDVAFLAETCYWVEIVGAGEADNCWFLWHDSTQGDGGYLQATNTAGSGYTCPDDLEGNDNDMYWCLFDDGAGVDLGSPCGCLP